MQSVLITDGAGFIGQNLVHTWRAARQNSQLIVVDAMTYAAGVRSFEPPIETELGDRRSIEFEAGLRQILCWYHDQEDWWRDVTSDAYKAWIDENYGFRIAV
jgi:dTDP-D-glucose 4,6-dehydratase